MDEEKYFDPFTDRVPYTGISRLGELHRRAKNLIKNRSRTQLNNANSTIRFLISEYFYSQKESWINDQLERGGSTLGYLDYEYRTEEGLKELIDNPRTFNVCDDELDFPHEENTRPLDALMGALSEVDLDDLDFPNASTHEYVAILAMRMIGEQVNSFLDQDFPDVLRDDAPYLSLCSLANGVIDITETVCSAESLEAVHHSRQQFETRLRDAQEKIPYKVEELARKKVSLSAKIAASARHKENSQLRKKAEEYWESSGWTFSSSAAFARTKHKEYNVTERTLYDWIRVYERSKIKKT